VLGSGGGVGVARHIPDLDVAVRVAGDEIAEVLAVGAERRDASSRPMTGVELGDQLTLGVTLPEPHPAAGASRHEVTDTASDWSRLEEQQVLDSTPRCVKVRPHCRLFTGQHALPRPLTAPSIYRHSAPPHRYVIIDCCLTLYLVLLPMGALKITYLLTYLYYTQVQALVLLYLLCRRHDAQNGLYGTFLYRHILKKLINFYRESFVAHS